jgi:hypothetical protein
MNFRTHTVNYKNKIVPFFSLTNLENLADHKWSADRTLGNTAVETQITLELIKSALLNQNKDSDINLLIRTER